MFYIYIFFAIFRCCQRQLKLGFGRELNVKRFSETALRFDCFSVVYISNLWRHAERNGAPHMQVFEWGREKIPAFVATSRLFQFFELVKRGLTIPAELNWLIDHFTVVAELPGL